MPIDAPPGPTEDRPGDDASAGHGTSPGATVRPRSRVTGLGRLRQRPPAWTALLTGVFAVGVFAATDRVLRLLADPAPASAPASAPGGASPGGGSSPSTAEAPADPAAGGATPTPPSPAAGAPPAPAGGPANDSDGDDTNVDEAAEGPRRAAPAKPSDEEPPEFRESADNNISLPVDI